jgi:hypothetical protein
MRGGVKHLLVIIPAYRSLSSGIFWLFWKGTHDRFGIAHRLDVVAGTVKFCKLFSMLDFNLLIPLNYNDLPLPGFCNF